MVPCEFVLLVVNPLRRSCVSKRSRCGAVRTRRFCVSKRSRCGAVRMRLALGEPFAEILHVEALSLWRRSVILFSLLAKRCLEVVSWFAPLLSRSRAVSGSTCLAHGSSGLKTATFNYESSTRRAFPGLRLQYRNFSAQKWYAKCASAVSARNLQV